MGDTYEEMELDVLVGPTRRHAPMGVACVEDGKPLSERHESKRGEDSTGPVVEDCPKAAGCGVERGCDVELAEEPDEGRDEGSAENVAHEREEERRRGGGHVWATSGLGAYDGAYGGCPVGGLSFDGEDLDSGGFPSVGYTERLEIIREQR